MAIPRQWSVSYPPVHDELHALHAAAEMRVKVSSDGWEGNFVLLVGRVLGFADVERVSENSVEREEPADKDVPIRQIVPSSRPLCKASAVAMSGADATTSTYRVATEMLAELHQLQQALPLHALSPLLQ